MTKSVNELTSGSGVATIRGWIFPHRLGPRKRTLLEGCLRRPSESFSRSLTKLDWHIVQEYTRERDFRLESAMSEVFSTMYEA